jgi:endo-1,4-beta-D-glucanase Y
VRRVVAVFMLSVAVAACGRSRVASPMTSPGQTSAGMSTPPATSLRANAATRFLTRYVTSDGRVIRHDQGGDIVSEGQAYAMLLAEIAHQPALVRTIWSWTEAHLGRADGLFAWHASGSGEIQDPRSATDADILIAYALLRYAGEHQAALHRAGRRVATAVLANESVTLPDGATLPVAGPWAKSTSPPTVNPSYLMPGVFSAIARLTGDARWKTATRIAVTMIGDLTSNGLRLPPDWAQLSGGRLVPIPAPSGGASVQYGLDAARLPIWFATACDTRARTLAADWWRNVLGSGGRAGATALGLGGATINPQSSPLTLIAGAAAATAAGAVGAASTLRARADAVALQASTYYGDAWAALGPALLDGSLHPC